MARTVEQIEQTITTRLQSHFSLSTSAVAEWRLWVGAVAYAIHLFELVLDTFRTEMDNDAAKGVAGTKTWYRQKCYEFQYGHELLFDNKTGLLCYAQDDPLARVVKVAAVDVQKKIVYLRVATLDVQDRIVPLSSVVMIDFKNYIDSIKFAGTQTAVISTTPDLVHYVLRIWYKPSFPVERVRELVLETLATFRTSQQFGGVLYRHKLLEAVTELDCVVMPKLQRLTVKANGQDTYAEVDTMVSLQAGYFDYDTAGCELQLTSISDLE